MKKLSTMVFVICCIVAHAQNLDTWTQLGMVQFPENPSIQTTGMGRVSELCYHPTDSNILFAVSASGGLWRSSNEGQSWRPLTDNLPRTACASVCVNRLNPKVIYLGTGDADYNSTGLGVWKSVDGGKTWFQSTTGMGNKLVSAILMHPADTSTLIAAASDGIYKSTDRGGTWTKKTTVTASYRDLVKKANNGTQMLYAATDANFYRSPDMGETWIQSSVVAGAAGIKIGVTPADSQVLYCVVWSNGSNKFGGLYRSTNDGAGFTTQSTTPNVLGYSSDGSSQDGQGAYNLAIAVDPANASIIYVAGINIWKSADAGVNWTLKSHWVTGVHADKHCYLFSPFNNKKLYIAHDGGLDRTADGGNTWTTLSDGLSASEFYKMGQSMLRKEIVIGGLQDNGLDLYRNGIFSTIKGGDWTGDFNFDYKDTNILYFNGGNRKFISAGEEGINGTGLYQLHPTDTNTMFYGTTNVFRTTNLKANPSTSVSWTQISSFGGGTITAMSCSRSNPSILYCALNNGTFYRCDNALAGSPVFNQLAGKPAGNIGQIIQHGKDQNFVTIVIGTKIYRSADKGQTWADLTANLPALNIVKAIVDEYSVDTVTYVANALGVYYIRRFVSTWNSFSNSLPTVAPISDMEIYFDTVNMDNSRLRMSTYGRGIWQTDLYRSALKAPAPDFSIHRVGANCSGYYMLNDISTNSPSTRKWSIVPATGWTYVNGSDSTSRNPEIRLNTPGTYTVALLLTGPAGVAMKSQPLVYSIVNLPTACNPATTNLGNYSIGIYNFEFNTINNTSPYSTYTSPNVEDFTCSKNTFVRMGATYQFWVTNGTSYAENSKVYIDYNNNGTFETTELAGSIPSGLGRRAGNITIPIFPTPVLGTYLRLRVISDYNAVVAPCSTLSYGEAEDYAVLIDTLRPSIKMNFTKPMVHKVFSVQFVLNKYAEGFDATDVTVQNGTLSNFIQTGPLTYSASVKPTGNGWVTLGIATGKITDLAGNVNRPVSDSTEFRLAFTSFTFPGKSISDSMTITPGGGRVDVKVPYGTAVTSLVPQFSVTDNAPADISGTGQISAVTSNNYTSPVTYTLTSTDNQVTKTFTVYVKVLPNTTCSLLTYSIQSPVANGTITHNTGGGSVQVFVPFGTNKTALASVFTLSDSATAYVNAVKQVSGTTANNFNSTVQYKLMAQDTAYSCIYNVQVTAGLNNACDMLGFSLQAPAVSGTITPTVYGGLVTVNVPFGTNRNSLTALFTLSDSAHAKVNSVLQQSGTTANNFTDTVVYVVTAQDGLTTKTYKVVVKVLPNTACDLLTFAFNAPAVMGTINGNSVKLTVPFGTNVSNLVATFTVSANAKVKVNNVQQQSGVTANNFVFPLQYIVTAENGTNTKTYTVNVGVSPNTACDLISYQLVSPAVAGTITPSGNGGTVNFLLSPSVNLQNLKASFVLPDSAWATVNGTKQQSGVSINDFSNPFTLVVHAQDSQTTKQYVVSVTINTGMRTATDETAMEIYPNPGDGHFTFVYHCTSPMAEDMQLQITNLLGQEVWSKMSKTDCSSTITYPVDLHYQPAGIYLLRIQIAGKTFTKKLVVQ